MTVLNIYSLNDIEQANVIASLPEGKHVIGRGDLLQVSDKRVSRQHAIIEVSHDKITLTSVHINPCFFKAVNGNTLIVIKQNQVNELNDGDQFALLPDFWFKVKIRQAEDNSHTNGKRFHDSNLEEGSSSKRAKLLSENNVENIERPSSTNDITEESLNTHHNAELNHLERETNSESDFSLHLQETADIEDLEQVKKEPLDDNQNIYEAVDTSLPSVSGIVKQENQDNEVDNNVNIVQENAQTVIKTEGDEIANEDDNAPKNNPNETDPQAPPSTKREKCWYGDRCFRKNPNHRTTFSHPGDQDYESDTEEMRPDCPYGVACYRTNPAHRRDYKHTTKPAPKPTQPNPPAAQNDPATQTKPKRKRPIKQRTPQSDPNSDNDDYDYDDPFLNDDSSDDFEPTSDSSDSGWEDSQEVVAESQDRKRMLREAKKFTRNKAN